MALKQFLLNMNLKINKHANKFPQPYVTFAVFGILTYPLYYFLWKFTMAQGYENLTLRLIVVVMCVLLLLKDYWPKKFRMFLPLYWYVLLLYSLPFLFTFLLLKNQMSYGWAMNGLTVLILSILLLDLFALFFILTLGVSLGIILFLFTGGTLNLPSHRMTVLITYCSVLFFGAIFSYRKDQLKEREKRIAAEAANYAKTEFIANMGHDLITPFSGIGGIANVLHSNYSDKYPELKDFFAEMVKSCIAWEEVHARIIKAASINEQETKPEYFPIHEELYRIENMMSSILSLKNLKFVVHPIEDDYIEIDRLRFHLILVSLIGNAINFTEQGEISVSISKSTEWFYIKITDTGIGIPADKFEFIFEQFTKLSRSQHYGAHFKGVGSGLYLAKQRANSLGGTIEVESVLGEGSTFTLSVPTHPHLPHKSPVPSRRRKRY